MQKTVLLISFTVACICCNAQFNDSVHRQVKFASTGILNKTNAVSSYVVNNIAAYNVNKKNITFNSSANWVYGQQNGNLTNNDFLATANMDLNKQLKKLYYWALLTYQTSLSLNIDYRFQGGAGIGYNLMNTPTANIVVSDGILFEKGNLADPNIGKDVYQTIRNSLRIKYRFIIKDKLVFEGMHFYQPSFSELQDYNISSINNLSVKLKQWLSLTAATTYNRIQRTNRQNLLVTFGFVIEKYF